MSTNYEKAQSQYTCVVCEKPCFRHIQLLGCYLHKKCEPEFVEFMRHRARAHKMYDVVDKDKAS